MEIETLAQKYRKESWLDPRLEVRQSQIEGNGLFANAPIAQGERVIVWGGDLMIDADIQAGRHRPNSHAEIDEGIYLAGRIEDPQTDPDEFLNHSCDPNLWMADEITLVAKRDIEKDEEVTADYAMWASRGDRNMQCNCKSKDCRHKITGNDWQRKDLQERYKGHFSPYLNRRIETYTS